MHGLIVAPGNRYLDPIDKTQIDLVCGRPRFGQAAEFVVIGQRQQFDAIPLGAPDYLGRRQQAVGYGRMAVQISVKRFHAAKNSSIICATCCG
jgi:hypothetical protein